MLVKQKVFSMSGENYETSIMKRRTFGKWKFSDKFVKTKRRKSTFRQENLSTFVYWNDFSCFAFWIKKNENINSTTPTKYDLMNAKNVQ